MLPPNIQNLVGELIDRTKNGQVDWQYDDFREVVSADLRHFKIILQYEFNMLEEVGQFNLQYYDKDSGKQYEFSTNQLYRDYSNVKYLFDIAKSSGLTFKF